MASDHTRSQSSRFFLFCSLFKLSLCSFDVHRSQTLAPGKSELKRIDCDIRISLATLDEKLVNQERSSVKLIQHEIEEDEADTTTFVLANLIPGKASDCAFR